MPDGHLALVFDDGYRADYETVLPVLAERDVAATAAIVPADLNGPDTLSTDQLRALVEAGWSVAAHGRHHRYCQRHGLAADVAPGDRSLVLDSDNVFPGEAHGLLPGDDVEVTDGTAAETHTVAETVSPDPGTEQPTLVLEGSVTTDFAADEAVVRLAASTLEDEVVGAKRELADLGLDPTTFVLPYDAGDPRTWRLVAEHYDALANAAVRSLPNPPDPSPLDLRRYYLETDTLRRTEIEDYLDLVADRGGVGILAGHSAWETVTAERVAAVVDAAHERDVTVGTVREALSG